MRYIVVVGACAVKYYRIIEESPEHIRIRATLDSYLGLPYEFKSEELAAKVATMLGGKVVVFRGLKRWR